MLPAFIPICDVLMIGDVLCLIPKFMFMNDRFNVLQSSIVCVDPCPLHSKSLIRLAATVAGVLIAPCGLPGKIVGGTIGYLCGSKLADKAYR